MDKPAGSIDAPAGFGGSGPSSSTRQAPQTDTTAHDQSISSRRSARATRVVGQLDHPILPEPPVSIYEHMDTLSSTDEMVFL